MSSEMEKWAYEWETNAPWHTSSSEPNDEFVAIYDKLATNGKGYIPLDTCT